MRIFKIGLAAGAAVALTGCAYNGLGVGVGYGSGYGGYGYGGYYDPYDPFYSSRYGGGFGYGYGYPGYGYGGYGMPYFGWYNGYYYPGSGYYVYDRYRRSRRMTAAERAYWNQRVAAALADRIRERRGETTSSATTQAVSPNWSGFSRPSRATSRPTATSRSAVRAERSQRAQAREERRIERRSTTTTRSERRSRRGDDR